MNIFEYLNNILESFTEEQIAVVIITLFICQGFVCIMSDLIDGIIDKVKRIKTN